MHDIIGSWWVLLFFLGFIVFIIVMVLMNAGDILGPGFEFPPLFGGD